MGRNPFSRPQRALFLLATAAIASLTSMAFAADGFSWQDGDGHTMLLYDGAPALQYMWPTYLGASDDTIQVTMKPYWHVFSPDGSTLLTKGPGGLYPHHRGLFYGFNKVTYGDGKHCDVWHCTEGAHQSHVKETRKEADGDRASYAALLHWFGGEAEPFAHEQRECAIARTEIDGVPGWMIDFASHLASADGKPIHLDGDPQHAGFHFRSSQEVADVTAKQTYYLRTDGKGKLGETRNWEPDAADSAMNKECENRPWNAMSMVVGGKRYTVVYLDHPGNPKPSRYSERDYGRFGSYFVADVGPETPLNVKYRVWVQEGEVTVEQCQKLSSDFNAEGTVLPTDSVSAEGVER
jgi:hypothetical protein